EVSDLLPHTAGCVDDLCVLRGCHGDSVTHPESVYLMNTGSILMGRPCLGAWATYGLGTENRNMPAFVVLPDPGGWVKGGAPGWTARRRRSLVCAACWRGAWSSGACVSSRSIAATPTAGMPTRTSKATTGGSASRAICRLRVS